MKTWTRRFSILVTASCLGAGSWVSAGERARGLSPDDLFSAGESQLVVRGQDDEGSLFDFLTIESGDPWTLQGSINELTGEDEPLVNLGGWFQLGYTNESDGVFNTVPDRFNLHQGWIYAEIPTDGSEGLDVGGRFDAVYGIDGENTQSYGNNRGRWDFADSFDHGVYHWALPQAYGTVAYEDLTVKVGHFYTLHGYEVVGATGNFFYSHAFTFNFMEPFTHTGVVATYKASDDVELYGGWVAGWDTGFDRFNGGSAFTGGFKAALTDELNFIYITTIGNNGWIGDGYTHSIVMDYAITEKLKYVLSSDCVSTNEGISGGVTTFSGVSAANYLLYQVTDTVGVGGRAEWAKFNGTSYYELTAGLNMKPLPNLIIRPEIRYQWAPGAEGASPKNPLGIPVDETIFGIDAILTF